MKSSHSYFIFMNISKYIDSMKQNHLSNDKDFAISHNSAVLKKHYYLSFVSPEFIRQNHTKLHPDPQF